MDLLGDLQAGIGNIAKAFLVVRYYKYDESRQSFAEVRKFDKKKAKLAMVKKEKDLVREAEQKLKASTSPAQALSSTGLGTKASGLNAGASKKTGDFTTFTVQYNPSSIKLSSVGGEQKFFGRQGMGQAGENIVSSVNSPTMTTLSFKLIFESINQMDAFIRESEDITGNVSSVGNLVGTGKNIYNKATKDGAKNGNSVKTQVESLMGAVMSDYTRDMLFVYGGTVFHGVLTGCSANYKMFNKAGDPILAEVELTLKQGETEQYDNDRWNKAFADYFDSDSVGMLSDAVSQAKK